LRGSLWARWVALAVALLLVLVLFVLPWVLVRPKASLSDVSDPGKRHERQPTQAAERRTDHAVAGLGRPGRVGRRSVRLQAASNRP
jgi:heme exporter protein D